MRHELHELSRMRLINWCELVNGAEGVSDIEGKAATGSGERAGMRASFKFVSHLLNFVKLVSSQSAPSAVRWVAVSDNQH